MGPIKNVGTIRGPSGPPDRFLVDHKRIITKHLFGHKFPPVVLGKCVLLTVVLI